MTFKDKMIDQLFNAGLFPDQAEQVVSRAMESDTLIEFKQRWNDRIEDYPSAAIAVLWVSVKRIALEWIDETCPQAWFRPLFTDEQIEA